MIAKLIASAVLLLGLALSGGCKEDQVSQEKKVTTETTTPDETTGETKIEKKEEIERPDGTEVEKKTEEKIEKHDNHDHTPGETKGSGGVDVRIGEGGVEVNVQGKQKDND